MPSFGNRLAVEFENDFARLANDWFLRWHDLARGEPIDIEDFRGGRIRPAEKQIDAAAMHAYWTATRRYASNKIEEVFVRVELEAGAKSGSHAITLIEDTTIALRSHLEKFHRHAVFTEYRLYGRGYPDERYLSARRDESIAAEIRRRKMALLKKYGTPSWWQRIAAAALETGLRRAVLTLVLISAAAAIGTVVFQYIS